MLRRGFTLVEVLVVAATVATLASLLLPALSGAREAARGAACGTSARQLAVAVQVYAGDFRDHAPPGAAEFLKNLTRWHGARARAGEAFTPAGGSLSAYLNQERGGDAAGGGRVCPTFRPVLAALASQPRATAGFERGCGGYGYNNAYLGVLRRNWPGGTSTVLSDRAGARLSGVVSPAGTIAFADAAFASGAGVAGVSGVIEYSFTEPRLWPETLSGEYRPDASVHFRHGAGGADAGTARRANVGMLDGHVRAMARGSTWSGGPMAARGAAPVGDALHLGWPGERDTNEWFDLE